MSDAQTILEAGRQWIRQTLADGSDRRAVKRAQRQAEALVHVLADDAFDNTPDAGRCRVAASVILAGVDQHQARHRRNPS